MTRLEKMIGFPVPKEHRKELNERLNTYENCDRTTLISLLLQYDWEVLQTQQVVQGKITKNVMGEYLAEVGTRIQSAIEATCSANAIAEMKRDSVEFFEKVYEMRNAQMDEALKCALYHEKSFLGLRTLRTKRDLDKATERRILAECEVDDYIKGHKEVKKQWQEEEEEPEQGDR